MRHGEERMPPQLARRRGEAARNLRMENGVSDIRVAQKQVLSRQEAARFLADLAEGLGDEGKVSVRLGSGTLELSVADQLNWELQVAVDGDGIALELELKWSPSGRAPAESTGAVSADGEFEDAEGEPQEVGPEGHQAEADQPAAHEPEEGESVPAAAAEEQTAEGEAAESSAGSGEAESEQQAAAAEEPQKPAPRRRRAAAETGKRAPRRRASAATGTLAPGRRRATAQAATSTFDGVDNAAVRAWAAANGLSVSSRGRIRDEVIRAYRDAGN
jgi:amphi-Trp domain-containing protein